QARPKASTAELERLIRQLGSGSFAERDSSCPGGTTTECCGLRQDRLCVPPTPRWGAGGSVLQRGVDARRLRAIRALPPGPAALGTRYSFTGRRGTSLPWKKTATFSTEQR